MARVKDTGISVTNRNDTHVTMLFGVDIEFTDDEVQQGRSGAATFDADCIIWDEDLSSDDRIVGARRSIAPERMDSVVGIDFPADLELSNLRSKETSLEDHIEIYAAFTVRKGFEGIASGKTRTVDVDISGGETTTTNNGRRISYRTEGTGSSTVIIVSGTGFTPDGLAVVRFTDDAFNMLQSSATADSAGKFEARRSVPCRPGIRITITAFEDADPSGTFANSLVLTCP